MMGAGCWRIGPETGGVTTARGGGNGTSRGASASSVTDAVVRYAGQVTHVGLGARLPAFESVTSEKGA